jgi:Spy/CpxP family protein refolding chaperone
MKRTLRLIVPALAIMALGVITAPAQQPQQPPQQGEPQQPGPPPPPDLADAMFPPDMIMQHQRELGLTDEQKAFMRNEINKTSTRFNDLQWQLQDAMEALHETMKADQVNEQQALAQLDKVLDAEREIKKLHTALAIRIKNNLTPGQVQKLQGMRHRGDGHGFGRGGGLGPGGPGGLGPGGPDGAPRAPKPGRPPGPGAPGPGAPGGPPPRPF